MSTSTNPSKQQLSAMSVKDVVDLLRGRNVCARVLRCIEDNGYGGAEFVDASFVQDGIPQPEADKYEIKPLHLKALIRVHREITELPPTNSGAARTTVPSAANTESAMSTNNNNNNTSSCSSSAIGIVPPDSINREFRMFVGQISTATKQQIIDFFESHGARISYVELHAGKVGANFCFVHFDCAESQSIAMTLTGERMLPDDPASAIVVKTAELCTRCGGRHGVHSCNVVPDRRRGRD